jgi:hypothetical protein
MFLLRLLRLDDSNRFGTKREHHPKSYFANPIWFVLSRIVAGGIAARVMARSKWLLANDASGVYQAGEPLGRMADWGRFPCIRVLAREGRYGCG